MNNGPNIKKEFGSYISRAWQRTKNGFRVLGNSFAMMLKHKKLFLFPVITTGAVIGGITLFCGIIYYIVGFQAFAEFMDLFNKKTPQNPEAFDYIILISSMFFLYLISSFIATFITVATSYFTFEQLTHNRSSLTTSLGRSFTRIGVILKWSLAAAIIKLMLTKKNGTAKAPGFLRIILGDLIAIGWTLITFFIVPVIATEQFGFFHSMKQSAQTMKNTFGETAGVMAGFGLLTTLSVLIIFPGGIMCALFAMPWLTSFESIRFLKEANDHFSIFMFGCILFGPTALLLTFVLSFLTTLKIVFKTTVYAYATGKPTGTFPADIIKATLKK